MVKAAFLGLALLLTAPQERPTRFVAMDVYVDSGPHPLAAWQFELACDPAKARIVGVEGGEPAVYRAAPWYDPAALRSGRIVVAAFTAEEGAPAGRVRVARLHLEESMSVEVRPTLSVAAGPGGKRIDAAIEIVRPGGEK